MLHAIPALDLDAMRDATARQQRLTKPAGSLGRLEELSIRLAGMTGRLDPPLDHAVVFTLAADHEVAAEGVSAYPREATAQMVLNFLRGGAAINAFARAGGIELKVVDVGVAPPLPFSSELIGRSVAPGTRNFCEGPAMTDAEMNAALDTGIELACDSAMAGCDLLGFGEMGIGNTTSAS